MSTDDRYRRNNGARSRSTQRGDALSEMVLGGDAADELSGISRREIVRALLQFKGRILISFVVVTAVVVAGAFWLPPTYTSSAKLLVNPDLEGSPAFFSGVAALQESQRIETEARRLETEMAILETLPLAREVVDSLGLTYDQVYRPAYVSLAAPVLRVTDRIRSSWFGKDPPDRWNSAAVAGLLRRSISVEPAKPKSPTSPSDIVVVRLRGPDGEIAQRSLDEYLSAYKRLHAQLNDQAGRAAFAIVQSEMRTAADELARAEDRLREFIAARSGRGRDVISTPGDEASVAQMKQRLVELEIDLLEARRVYREESEQVQSLRGQVAALRRRVDSEVIGTASNLTVENQLTRGVREAETRYTELLRKAEGISLYLQANQRQVGNRVVIEPPSSPSSSDWKRRVALSAVGSGAGLAFGILLAAMSALFSATFASRDQAVRSLNADVVSVLPAADLAEVRALQRKGGPNGTRVRARSERMFASFGELASSIAHSFPERRGFHEDGCVLLVTSVQRGEGKSTVASGVAAHLRRLGFGSVLLVDAGLDPEAAQGVPAGALHPDAVVPALPWPPLDGTVSDVLTPMSLSIGDTGQHVLLHAGATRAFLREARRRYDWVILDGGSIRGGGVGMLDLQVDGILLVVDSGSTRRAVVVDALRRIGSGEQKFQGVILNRDRWDIPSFIYQRL